MISNFTAHNDYLIVKPVDIKAKISNKKQKEMNFVFRDEDLVKQENSHYKIVYLELDGKYAVVHANLIHTMQLTFPDLSEKTITVIPKSAIIVKFDYKEDVLA